MKGIEPTLKKIKILRNVKDHNQKTMGEKLNLSESAYNKIENGETDLTMQKLAQIANIFGVDKENLSNNNKTINVVFTSANETIVIINNHQINNNNENNFIDYLKSEFNKQRQELETKNEIIQTLKQEINNLKKIS